MKIDFTQPHPPEGDVLSLRGIHFTPPTSSPYDAGMEDVSFQLQRSALALMYLEQGNEEHPLADMISGLVVPDAGELRVFNHVWSAWNADAQARARWRIGRVFAGQGWISNLDVDENITLAERHHARRLPADIDAEVRALARMAGLAAIPNTRPPVTDREELRRAEWVRSALGTPWLMVLERPGAGLADGWMDDLKPLIEHVRSRGTAVIWMCESDDEWTDDSLKPSLKLRAEGNKLLGDS